VSKATLFRCRAVRPKIWNGRYLRVPGETTAFHVRLVEGDWWPVVDWLLGDETGHCPMVDDDDAPALAAAVNAGKAALHAGLGGAFLIDEYGRVLVPAHDGKRASVVVVAECSGPLRFENAFQPGTVFDLYDDQGLESGDPWERPYVGLRHNLSRRDELYFWHEDAQGAQMLYPPSQDAALIASLRQLRPYGPVRFLAGPGGVVITKLPPAWEPCYVGRIDLAGWFPKEKLG
jgi:hypothetical protein